jgi:hypothetical protein
MIVISSGLIGIFLNSPFGGLFLRLFLSPVDAMVMETFFNTKSSVETTTKKRSRSSDKKNPCGGGVGRLS